MFPHRNWCEITEDGTTHDVKYSLRCETALKSGKIMVWDIEVPTVRTVALSV